MKANAQLRIWTCYCLSATQTSWTWKILHETKFRKKKKEEIEQEQTEETFPWLKEKKISYFNLDFCLFVCLSTLCPRSAIIVFTPGGHQQFADNPSYSLKDKKTQKKKKRFRKALLLLLLLVQRVQNVKLKQMSAKPEKRVKLNES